MESGEVGLARGRDVRVPGGCCCTREGIVEGAQVVSRGQTDRVEALANSSQITKGKKGRVWLVGVDWIGWNGME